jgi:23S rRNA (guanosine2251-2'-O)-methyltransferase
MSPTPSNLTLLEGEISVMAALSARHRNVHRIVLSSDKPREDVRALEALARAARVNVERASREQVDALAQGKTHGGVVAEVGERRFLSLEELLPRLMAHSGHKPPALSPEGRGGLVVMLDGIEDPFNFGQAVRALYAAGVNGLVVRPRNWMSAAAVVARASAGAIELMPTALADDPQTAAAFFQQRGLLIAVTARDRRAVSIYDTDLTRPMFLVIGGEKRGISREFMAQAGLLLKVPYRRKFPHSLGTAASAAVIAFEVMRQRFGRAP